MHAVTPVAAFPVANTLVITNRSVKVGDHVYPIGNICHFGPGVRTKKLMPWRILGCIFGVGLLLSMIDSLRAIGVILALAATASFIYDQTQGRRFGLMLMLNSGTELFFETTDSTGVVAVSEHVYAMLERVDRKDEPKQVTVNQNKVTIRDTTVTGALNAGIVGGDVETDVLNRECE